MLFSGIQYMINEKTSNCSIQGIPLTALDAVPAENQHIRLRHASELISIDPNMFIYKGTVSVKKLKIIAELVLPLSKWYKIYVII